MIYELSVLQFSKMLKNLSAMLDKASEFAEMKKFDPGVLLQSRLAPDQFNFTRQVQITCDTAKLCVASLANKEAPVHPDEEVSIQDLKARIESVISFLGKFSKDDFSGARDCKVTRPRWEGKHMSGPEFLVEHAVPNFYFHLTTAYSILRHNGVDLGKKNFLGELPYKKN